MDQGKAKKFGRPALGRGLSSLISSAPVSVAPPAGAIPSPAPSSGPGPAENADTPPPSTGIRYMAVSRLIANPKQPRQTFTDAEINELAASIKERGILQPILVRPIDEEGEQFEIVAGERRFRAANQAGLAEVPVLVKALSDKETLEIALIENVQRQNLNPVEEALAYQRLMDEFQLTAAEVAERVSKDRATVANIVRVLKLPATVLQMVRDGVLSLGHAKAILTVKEPSAQINLANKVIQEHLSVRALEAIVSRTVVLEPPKPEVHRETRAKESALPEVEDRLRNSLGTKVSLKQSRPGRGVIELHYFSDQELERLIDLLSPKGEL